MRDFKREFSLLLDETITDSCRDQLRTSKPQNGTMEEGDVEQDNIPTTDFFQDSSL